MTSSIRRPARIATVLALGSALVLSSAPAEAKDLEVRSSGKCSTSATWKLKAKAEGSRIEVELEVDSNVNGQAWSVALRDQGVLVHSGSYRTLAPSGSFEVSRLVANRAGTDTITAVAVHTASGQRCSGSVSFPG
jgi:hypothetical protein